jgi:hypothetical protein
VNTVKFAQWYQYMMVLATATMITGGRLSAGLLFTHINTMGQVLEMLASSGKVAINAAFMVCFHIFLLCRAFNM